MDNVDLTELKNRLDALAVFRSILSDSVMEALCQHLDSPSVAGYSEFVARLYEANNGDLGGYIKDLCDNCENVYVRAVGQGNSVGEHIKDSVNEELKTLQSVIELTPTKLCEPLNSSVYLPEFKSGGIDIAKSYRHRVQNIDRYGYGIYAKNSMFYIDDARNIVPVKYPDTVSLDSLIGYKSQRQIIMDNTKALLAGKPASNILLTGDAGTGKSSTVKAVANALSDSGLRIIEIRKDQLGVIPRILDELTVNPLKFILFIDDLSFLKDDDNFNALKAVLEGSVSARSSFSPSRSSRARSRICWTSALSRVDSFDIIERSGLCASDAPPSESISAAPRMPVSGVLISCETSATNSRRNFSVRASSRILTRWR